MEHPSQAVCSFAQSPEEHCAFMVNLDENKDLGEMKYFVGIEICSVTPPILSKDCWDGHGSRKRTSQS